MVKVTLGTALAIVAVVLFCSIVGLVPEMVHLGVMPWETHQETLIYRNSLGASSANIAQLRNLFTSYVGTNNVEVRAAIAALMHSVADNMNAADVPPDLRAFLITH